MALMSDGEFKLIERLFKNAGGSSKPFTRLGIGDDASIHRPEPGMELVVSTDTSVQGVHWPDDFPLHKAADRAVCSALSDLAAMGAEAVCVWLNVMAENSAAVETMGKGATDALKRYDIELAGGDTCRSATNAMAVTVAGQLPEGTAMRRDAAASGDAVWIVGRIGFHALGLQQWMNGEKEGCFVPEFERIVAQLEAGILLRQAGSRCCIDISDGLLQDAGHIARASGVCIEIEAADLPEWTELCEKVGEESALQAMTHGGEDYALLFTAPEDLQMPDSVPATRIGCCKEGEGVHLCVNGQQADIWKTGFDHFG